MPDLTANQIAALAQQGGTKAEIVSVLGRKMTTAENRVFHQAKLARKIRRPTADSVKSPAQHKRERLAREADIGTPHAPANPERVEACRNDLEMFGYQYFPAWVTRAPSTIIRSYIERLTLSMTSGGVRTAIAIPRGYGKTTWVKIAIIWAILYGHCSYAVIFAASDTLAWSIIADIIDQLEGNDELDADFNAATKPFREMRGAMQRAKIQTMGGVRTKVQSNRSRVVFPTVPGQLFSGSVVTARGITSGFLGLVKDGKRPDFALLDDVQSMKRAESDAEVDRMERAIQGGVIALGSHDRPISVVMTCTVVRENDLSDRYLDIDLHPEFKPIRHGLVIQWPESDKWDRYRELWQADQRTRDTNAAAFYRKHRAEMDADAVVSDDDLYNHASELSAIQHAYHALFSMGRKAFFSQMQNAPVAEDVRYSLTVKGVASQINSQPRYIMPDDASACVVFSDINHDAVRWCSVAFATMGRFYIIDYGRFPQRGVLVPENASDADTQRLVYAGLAGAAKAITSSPFTRRGSRIIPRAWGIDRGYKPEVVHAYANSTRLPFPVLPSRGFAASRYAPTKAIVGEPGYECHISETQYGQFLATNADHWREFAQRAFLPSPGSPGSCSLWGGDTTAHWEFAEHICAEVLTDKGTGQRGTPFYRWAMKPGMKNDYLDCIVGAIATGSWFRAFSAVAAEEAQQSKQVTTRPKREKRRCKVSIV
jgi:hypothetical protein